MDFKFIFLSTHTHKTLHTSDSASVLTFSNIPPVHTKENGKQMPCQD